MKSYKNAFSLLVDAGKAAELQYMSRCMEAIAEYVENSERFSDHEYQKSFCVEVGVPEKTIQRAVKGKISKLKIGDLMQVICNMPSGGIPLPVYYSDVKCIPSIGACKNDISVGISWLSIDRDCS